jgi:hypothetical protein
VFEREWYNVFCFASAEDAERFTGTLALEHHSVAIGLPYPVMQRHCFHRVKEPVKATAYSEKPRPPSWIML